MLFFTQCFGAVLDLIHLRFQHNKAKRVFSAAGQLVCVVNPTHNLKVSGWLLFDVPVARVQILPRRRRGGGGGEWRQGPSHGARGAPGKGHPPATQDGVGHPSLRSAPSPSLGVWMLSRRCVFPCLAGATGVSVYFFYPTLSA